MNQSDPEASIRAAYSDAKARGLPDCWTCTIDKRNRRKWTAPTGRSCDSIPKALAISVELGLLPPDTQIQYGPNKRKRPPPLQVKKKSAKLMSQWKKQRQQNNNSGSGGFKRDDDDDEDGFHDAMDDDESSDDSEDSEEARANEPPPEPMDPETSLDGLKRAAAATTVHWDGPHSADGKLVGWVVKVLLPSIQDWQTGRVILYDPYTHKHKIAWDDSKMEDSWIWLRNEEHTLQLATRLVWAHVKGYAWWPALVMEDNTASDLPLLAAQNNNNTTPHVNRHVQVEFLSTAEFSSLRDSSDCLREFSPLSLDPVVARHKKKRNAKAVTLANTEWKTIRRTQRDASLWYARKAWRMAQQQGNGWIGKRVQVFRNDVNYPYGDTVVAKVKMYSTYQRKWLLAYEMTDKQQKYEASWVNLQAKQADMQILDKRPAPLTLEDMLPFVFQFEYDSYEDEDEKANTIPSTTTSMDKLVVSHKEMAQLYRERCHACVEFWKQSDVYRYECSVCQASFHLGCCDPPLSLESFQRMLKEGKPLVCTRCQPCRGCFSRDIVFGSHPYTPRPPSLSWPHTSKSLDLCSMCKDAYDEQRFCPNCAHTWDDIKFQKIRKQMEYPVTQKKNQGAQDTLANIVLGDFTVDAPLPEGSAVPQNWYYPETSEWGYTEIEMLVCDGCKIWVHAGCAGISEEEYNETSEGEHPIYSKEFLCRVCCRQRCQDIIKGLREQDVMGVFAVPVTDKVAPNYHDVIQNPMDLQTMQERAQGEEYLNYAWVREAFELIVLNALTFNNYYTKFWNEAKRFFQAGLDNVFKTLGKAAPPGKYDAQIKKCFAQAEEARQKEMDRMQIDETVEKKDLVVGSLADALITLPKLQSAPPDQESCVPCAEVKLKHVDAFYYSWMDACYTCGSSGATDTMVFCVDCGEAYHSFCANAPVHSMTKTCVAGWRCPNCKVCEISGDVPPDETHLIFCEMCDRAFSLGLLDPPLEEAPPGLWICGQCVDCKECNNTGDPRGASLKHWSRDPDKCYSCGGCQGLVDESDVTKVCKSCRKLLHMDEPAVVQCHRCSSRIHCRCDSRAAKYVRSKENATRAKKAQKVKDDEPFVCSGCLTPEEIAAQLPETIEIHRHGMYETAWRRVVQSDLNASEGHYGRVEYYAKLVEEMEWSVRNMWRDEYLSIVQDAVRVFNLAQASFEGARNIIQPVFNRVVDVPLWKAQRALRFIGMVERGKWNESIDIKSIAGIVMAAKVASAFLDVSSLVMGYNLEAEASCADRISLLLEEPDECETTLLPYDKIMQKVDTVLTDVSEMDANDTFEQVDSIFRTVLSKPSEDSQETPSVLMADPLIGWSGQLSEGEDYGDWKDPRECCLCHLCGDDDAGFVDPVGEELKNGRTAHLGRLLPMPDGYWAHTACALWSSEVWEAQEDGLIHAVEKARSRGSQLKCFGCGRHGATVGCNKSNCSFNYHFPCAKACGAVFTPNQHMYCSSHSACATQLLRKASFEPMKALIISPEKKGAEKDVADNSDDDLCSRVGSLVVHSIGKIDQTEDGFHNENYITPPGYFATRIFWSTIEPRKRTLYILQVQKSEDGRAEFCINATDNSACRIRSQSPSIAYSALMDRVRKVNAGCFSHGDLFSRLPMMRRSRRKTFGLNGNQFFGFGLNHVRRMLESCPGVEAVVTPLTQSSAKYRFCFVQPTVESIRDLQRRRAAAKAELALENSTGCARTEGLKAVAQSGGSGRITRALVRSADEEVAETNGGASTEKISDKSDRGMVQVKYRKMSSVPMEQRLAARRSHIHGWGLFTKIDILKNDPIVEYMGEVIRQPIADKREKQYEISGEGSCYMFRLDRTRIVDATMIGCMARFMNHSCTSNAYAKIISVDTESGQEKKIVVFANRDIAAGEEITYDYKFPVEDGSLRCTCGAANCIGRLN